jgi:hypothetical protein
MGIRTSYRDKMEDKMGSVIQESQGSYKAQMFLSLVSDLNRFLYGRGRSTNRTYVSGIAICVC